MKITEAQPMTTGRDIICETDETTMTGIVMMLTGGSANPSVVRHHIQRVKAEREVGRKVPKLGVNSGDEQATATRQSRQENR